jgi:hypothetical protein
MELKPLASRRPTSREALILAITAVIITACLATMFSGCVKKEEVPMEATRQLVIPPEYEPEAVLPGFGGEIFYECVYEVGKETGKDVETKTMVCIHDIQDIVEGRLEEDFIKGYVRAYSIYTLKSGDEAGIAYPLLRMFVLKYKTSESAEEAFILDTEFMELKWEHNPKEPIVYMLQSNNFIIYTDGSVEPCTDIVSRIIELYSVPKDNSY